ncbi:MAG: threonine ammonia-lyase [Deltaproteobacteria bacterium]
MVTFEEVKKVQEKLEGVINKTNLIYSSQLSTISGTKVYFKPENMQKTGSFKIRGAYNKISSLSDEEKNKSIIAVSAGNHAQGVALAASIFGIKSTVVMPKSVPQYKIHAAKNYGAEVIIQGNSIEEAKKFALQRQGKEQIFIHPYDDSKIIAGQGTIGIEMLEELPGLETIIVPVGGGGLISGIAIAAKALKPSIKIVGVEIEGYESVRLSISTGKVVEVPGKPTIADGIAINTCGDLPYEIIKRYVDDIIIVSEKETKESLFLLLQRAKILVEGAGAVGLAALLSERTKIKKGEKVGIVLSGGNLELEKLRKLI